MSIWLKLLIVNVVSYLILSYINMDINWLINVSLEVGTNERTAGVGLYLCFNFIAWFLVEFFEDFN